MFEIGNTLREARLRRGLTASECEVGTKVRAKYLRAIEEEHFEVLPSPAYVRGFLTTYADYLGLDGRLLMDEYEHRFGAGTDVERRREERHQRARARRRRSRARGGRSAEAKLGWLGLGGAVVIGVLMMQGMGDPAPETPFVPPAKDPAQAAGSGASEEVAAPLSVRLRGEGDTGSFVEVHRETSAGAQVWAGLLKSGGTKSFPITTRLWVRTYNAPGLSVTVKGKTRRFTGSVAAFTVDQNGVVPEKAGN